MRWLLGVIHLGLIIWALMSIWGSAADTTYKIVWSLAVIIFPIVGFVVWFLAGPKAA